MSRSLGSDGIHLYCDAAVALTIVFATVIAMVAAVIVGSNPLNFSVAIIALCLPVQSHFSLAAQLTQNRVRRRRRSIWTLSSDIAIEPERGLA
jgi:hypothetical protein